jgi:Protein of unknown function (DUF3137)
MNTTATSTSRPPTKDEIVAIAQELEVARAAAVARRKTFRLLGIAGGFLLAAGYAAIASGDVIESAFVFLFGVAGGALLGYGIGSGAVSKVETETRSRLVGAIARRHGLELTSEGFEPSDLALFQEVSLLPGGWDRVSFRDQLSGMHDGLSFVSWGAHCEVERTETSTNAQGETTTTTKWDTTFRGRVYAIDWKQDFLGKTYITRRGWFNFAPKGTYEIKPPDPRFIDAFAIFTTDGTEGHYLIDPLMIDRLVELEKANEGSGVRGVFFNQRLLLALNGSHHLVELKMSKSIDAAETLDALDRKVTSAFELVDQVS